MIESAVRLKLYTWLTRALGTREQFTLTFSADLVAGNRINGTFEGVAMDEVVFATSHAATMKAVARSILSTYKVWTAYVTGARQITCVGFIPGDSTVSTGPIVTGGASQAVATKVVTVPASNIQVIHGDQNSPRPSPYPYATIRLDAIRQLGHDEIRMSDTDPDSLLTNIGGQRVLTCMVQVVTGKDPGPRAMELAEQARSSLSDQSVLSYFYLSELAVLEILPITNLTEALETEFDQRAAFDFYVGFVQNRLDNVGIIEQVEIEGTVNETIDVEIFGPVT